MDTGIFQRYWPEELRNAGRAAFKRIEPKAEDIVRQVYFTHAGIPLHKVSRDKIQRGTLKLRSVLSGDFSPEYFATQRETVAALVDQGMTYQHYTIAHGFYQHLCISALLRSTPWYRRVRAEMLRAITLGLQCDAVVSMTFFIEALEERSGRERNELLQTLADSIGNVARAANAGELATRVDHAFQDNMLGDIAAHLNALLDGVERGVSASVDTMERISRGDLRARMSGNFTGAFGRMRSSIDLSVAALRETISAITSASKNVQEESGTLAVQSERLRKRSRDQASRFKETNAAAAELKTLVDTTASISSRAVENAGAAASAAENSRKDLDHTLNTMDGITASADRISEIITIIEDISSQTKLLAINATIEAARAGQSGSGFAVVATEVRNLASRASEAVAHVREQVKETGDQIRDGAESVNATVTSLTDLMTMIKEISQDLSSVGAQTKAQAVKFSAIAAAMETIDQVSRDNVMAAETASEISTQLNDSANRITAALEFFKTGDGTPEGVTLDPAA